MIDHWMEHRSW